MTPEERDIVLMRIQDDVDYLVEEIKKLRAEVRKAVAPTTVKPTSAPPS